MVRDATDDRLLALLREDARQPVTSLARVLHLSRAAVYARLERLEKHGPIASYTVKLKPDYNRRLIRAHVMIKVLPKLARATERQLAAMPGLTALYTVSGEHDLIAMVETDDVGTLDGLIDAIGSLEGVEKTVSSILLSQKLRAPGAGSPFRQTGDPV
ncbi:MAG: Lrp/AsnC family transcriptional regulator [Rhizomicrobium sp.]